MLENLYEIEDELTESINIKMDDETIDKANCSLLAYNCHVTEDEQDVVYNPKKDPERAVDILLEYPEDEMKIEIFLETESKEWNSIIHHKNGTGRLSPEQFGQFCSSDFYKKLHKKLLEMWPTKDDLFFQLNDAIENKRYSLEGCDCGIIDEESGKNDFGTGKVDPNKSREKNAAGKQIRSRSGRKYITPSDFNVKHDENEAYFCWPEKDKEFKWSQWADWEKIKPLLRLRFAMSNPDHVYGISMSPLKDKNENRGFRGYDITAQPPLQYLTPEETAEMMKLTIVQKFLKNAKKRIMRFISIPDEEIYEKVGNPEKCSIDDIRKTKHTIKNALEAIRDARADTYIYT